MALPLVAGNRPAYRSTTGIVRSQGEQPVAIELSGELAQIVQCRVGGGVDVAASVIPPVLLEAEVLAGLAPGDIVEINLVREGKDDHQAVGYTADGTMIVVNHAASRIGAQVDVIISGAVQTNAGRLVFAELKDAA